jgi:hypothetical protein
MFIDIILLYCIFMWISGFWLMFLTEGAKEEMLAADVSYLDMMMVWLIFPILFPMTVISLALERKRQ